MKKIVAVAMVTAFVFSAGSVFAAKGAKCTVDAVEGEKVTLSCKDTAGLKAGDSVSVKAKKKKAIEGC